MLTPRTDAFRVSTLVFGWRGPRILPAADGMAILERAEAMWRESDRTDDPSADLHHIVLRLRGNAATTGRRIVARRRGRLRAALSALGHLGLGRGLDPIREAPPHALWVNAANFPLDWPSHVGWLDRRPDVRPVIFVHDLLPIDHPSYFWPGEPPRHRRRLDLLAHRGAAAIVTTASVGERLGQAMRQAGRGDLPILRASPPVAPSFFEPASVDPRLAEIRYFVVCGTIEPRKNHRLLLRVWRRLVAGRGAAAPRLVVVGKRGWGFDEIVADLADPHLADHVVEVAGLPSPAYRGLLDHARALLAPSFAEGFGLPVAEARARNLPVVASDIAPFREQDDGSMTFIDPRADDLWHDAIVALCDGPRVCRPATEGRGMPDRHAAEVGYAERVTAFLRALP